MDFVKIAEIFEVFIQILLTNNHRSGIVNPFCLFHFLELFTVRTDNVLASKIFHFSEILKKYYVTFLMGSLWQIKVLVT